MEFKINARHLSRKHVAACALRGGSVQRLILHCLPIWSTPLLNFLLQLVLLFLLLLPHVIFGVLAVPESGALEDIVAFPVPLEDLLEVMNNKKMSKYVVWLKCLSCP